MKLNQTLGLTLGFLCLLNAHAGVLFDQGKRVKGRDIEYCFVGNGVANNLARVQEIQGFIAEIQRAVNVNLIYKGKCPAPTIMANGNEDYGTYHRINIAGSDIPSMATIPGKGCTHGWPNSSFSMFPQEADDNRSCQFTSAIWDDSDGTNHYRNHTLHEFSHGLGLGHEHRRTDAPVSSCPQPGFGADNSESLAGVFLTPFDPQSVMDYSFPTCGIFGNYSQNGLSALDVVSLRILYPEQGNPAAMIGKTVIRDGNTLSLTAGPQIYGGLGSVIKDVQWSLVEKSNPFNSYAMNGANVSIQPRFGRYVGKLAYKDFMGRAFSMNFEVKVLDAAEFQQEVLAAVVSSPALL